MARAGGRAEKVSQRDPGNAGGIGAGVEGRAAAPAPGRSPALGLGVISPVAGVIDELACSDAAKLHDAVASGHGWAPSFLGHARSRASRRRRSGRSAGWLARRGRPEGAGEGRSGGGRREGGADAGLALRRRVGPAEALREAVAGFWRTYTKRRGELIGVFQASMLEAEFLDRWLDIRAEAVTRIAGEIRRAQAAGFCPGIAPVLTASALVGDAGALLLHLAGPGRRADGGAVRRRACHRHSGHYPG